MWPDFIKRKGEKLGTLNTVVIFEFILLKNYLAEKAEILPVLVESMLERIKK
jgi:hypothetical protein